MTTHSAFNQNTEALEVAEAFADRIRGTTVLITGVNQNGIGFTTAEAFASQSPSRVIIAGRNESKMRESVNALRSRFPDVEYRTLKLDLSGQSAVRTAAAELFSWADVPTIDIIVNNAAIMNVPELTMNEDGIEVQFGTNHIGHFLFTCLILPKLIEAAKGKPKGTARIVNVSSLSPTIATMRWSDMSYEVVNKDLPEAEQPPYYQHKAFGAVDPENKSYLPLEGYNQSKVANLLFSIGANKRLYEKHGILSLALHPGIIQTELSRDATQQTLDAISKMAENRIFTFRTQGAGAATSLVAALDPLLGPGEVKHGKENYGAYLIDCQLTDKANALAESNEQAEKLWKVSEKLVKEKFAW